MDLNMPAKEYREDCNTCIGLGFGLGAFGAAAAAITGAVCPLCVVLAPGLVGYGVFKRLQTSKVKVRVEHND